ncbi:MAG: hypothetical protein G8D60_02240 [gamma proteobacterium symbiont of Phacoides pectinatus]
MVYETDIIKAFQRGRGTRGPGDYITLMAEKMVSRMVEVIESLEDASDGLSERLLVGDTQTQRSELAEVKRTIIRLRRYLAPQREALSGVCESDLEWLDDITAPGCARSPITRCAFWRIWTPRASGPA